MNDIEEKEISESLYNKLYDLSIYKNKTRKHKKTNKNKTRKNK